MDIEMIVVKSDGSLGNFKYRDVKSWHVLVAEPDAKPVWYDEVTQLISENQRMSACMLHKSHTGGDLYESKRVVDELAEKLGY